MLTWYPVVAGGVLVAFVRALRLVLRDLLTYRHRRDVQRRLQAIVDMLPKGRTTFTEVEALLVLELDRPLYESCFPDRLARGADSRSAAQPPTGAEDADDECPVDEVGPSDAFTSGAPVPPPRHPSATP